jgi:hypothetical protein
MYLYLFTLLIVDGKGYFQVIVAVVKFIHLSNMLVIFLRC